MEYLDIPKSKYIFDAYSRMVVYIPKNYLYPLKNHKTYIDNISSNDSVNQKIPATSELFFFRNPDKNCPQKFFSPKIHPPQLASPQIRARSFRKVHTLRVRGEIPPSKPESSLVVLPSHLKI